MDTGLNEKDRMAISGQLGKFLADTYALYLKTQYYHWNVKGISFMPMHIMFEKQYEELAGAVDEIAERIVILGSRSPGSFQEFAKLKSIKEAESVPDAKTMVMQLLADHESIIREARKIIELADNGRDIATTDLLTRRIAVHEKTAWMLRSTLE